MSPIEGQDLLRILRAAERFDDGWRRGEAMRLEDVVEGWAGPARLELLGQALAIELDYRRRRGEEPEPEEYEGRFPEFAEAVRSAFGGQATVSACASATIDSDDLRPLDAAAISPGPGAAAWRIGKYEVIGRLGGGGQGSAFLACDPDLARQVVLKRYHGGPDGAPGEVEEGRALARISSPYVARCLGVERVDGVAYLVIEYVPGRTLEEARRDGLLDLVRVVGIVSQVAEGVSAVHARGLIHRDIKPANVILHDDGTPRLVDFGLAAHLGSVRLRELSGSPPYMAPEQARCEWDRIDHRTDVFGLGALLYKLLTGRAPHKGETSAEILAGAKRGDIVPPRELEPTIPAAVEAICMKALSAAPENRQATALEFAAALRRAIEPVPSATPAPRPTRRVLAKVAAAAVLCLLPATAVWLSNGGSPGQGAHVAAPTHVPAEPIRAEISVDHFKELGDGRRIVPLGSITAASLTRDPPRVKDMLRIRVTLSRPAYYYLIALNPDGKDQLCLPVDGAGPESPRRNLEFPEDPADYFGLTDGAGLQAFVVVASERPLPEYASWKSRVPGGLTWSTVNREGLWIYDSAEPVESAQPAGQLRGEIFRREGAPADLTRLCERLRLVPGTILVRSLAFPVKPEAEVIK